jgi:regulator of replication initiation timing
MVNNENLDELSSIEKLSDEDLFKAFLTEGNQISMSDMSGSASYNESDSFNSTPEGYTQSSSDEIADTPPHNASPYSVDSNREIRHDNTSNQVYANYERNKQPSPPGRTNQARFPQRQYPSNQVIEHPQVLYPSSFGRTQLPIANNAHRPIQPQEPTVYKPPVLGGAAQSYMPQQQPIANYYRPAPYQPPTDPLKSQVEAQLESVLNDRIKQQQLQALQQAQLLFNAHTPAMTPVTPSTVASSAVVTPVNNPPMTPVMPKPVQQQQQQQQQPIRPAPHGAMSYHVPTYPAQPYEAQSDTPAYLPLPPLSTPNSRKRQRDGDEERNSAGEEDEEDRVMKRQKRLIKNRESAQLSRIRKKQYVDELEKRVSVLNDNTTRLEWRIEELQLENTMLRDDNGYLRELVHTQPGYAEHLRARDSARQHDYQQQRARLQEQRARNGALAPGGVRQQQAMTSMKAANVCLLIVIFAFGLFINSPDATSTILGPKNIVFVRDHSARSLSGLDVTELPHVNPQHHDASYGHDDRGEGEHNASHAVFCPTARHVLVKSGRNDVESNALSFVMKLNEFKRNNDLVQVMHVTDTTQPYLHVQCSAYTLSAVEMIDLDEESQIKAVTVDTRPKQTAQAA